VTARTPRRIAVLGGLTSLLVAGAHPCHAQRTIPAGYAHGSVTVPVTLHLDAVGVLPVAGRDPAALQTLLASRGLTLLRRMPAGWSVFTLAQPVSRAGIFALSASLRRDLPTWISSAGPLVIRGTRDTLALTDQVIVQYEPTASDATIDSLHRLASLVPLLRTPWQTHHYLLRVKSGSQVDPLAASILLSRSPVVRSAYPDFLDADGDGDGLDPAAVPASEPNDPYFPVQWHLANPGTTPGGDINAVDAWMLTQGKSDVILAVIELNGFDIGHEDLIGNLWLNPSGSVGRNLHQCFVMATTLPDPATEAVTDLPALDCSDAHLAPTGPLDPLDPLPIDHGTAVAGLAAAVGDNGIGVTGVCPRCRIMALRAGSSWYGKVLALLYARDHGASVISLSWNHTLQTALDWAVTDLVARGVPVVVSMGNVAVNTCGDLPTEPQRLTAITGVIGVGSSNDDDVRTTLSGTGSCLDLLAPGGRDQGLGIVTTDPSGASGYNASPSLCAGELGNNNYTACFGGVSASVPLVAGTLGLMRTLAPSMSPVELEQILQHTADPIDAAAAAYDLNGFSPTHGHGRLDTFCALRAIVAPGEPCTSPGTVTVNDPPVPETEFGTRLGVTRIAGATSHVVANAPGGGPMATPVFHLARYPTATTMLELQFGASRTDAAGSSADASSLALGLQAGTFLAPGWYAGPTLAMLRTTASGTTSTDWGAGVAAGYRVLPTSQLSLRLEARYRRWWTSNIDELGIALVVGVSWP